MIQKNLTTTNQALLDMGLVQKISIFPYPQRFCRYCERELEVFDALHVIEYPEFFKALYICKNEKCGSFDDEPYMQYTRTYYSSQEAYQMLELVRIWFKPEKKV